MWLVKEHRNQVHSLTFSPDGRFFASADVDGRVFLWEPATSRTPRWIEEEGEPATGVSFSPKGDRLLMCRSPGQSSRFGYWPAPEFDRFVGLESAVGSEPRMTPTTGEGLLLVGGPTETDSTPVELWDLRTWTSSRHYHLTSEYVPWGLVACNGSTIVTGGAYWNWTGIYDLDAEDNFGEWRSHPAGGRAVACRPGTRQFGTVGANQVRVWDIQPGRNYYLATGPELVTELPRVGSKLFNTLAFSDDGQRLAVGRNDGVVNLYDADTWSETATFRWPIGNVRRLTFSPDGLRAAAAGVAGAIVIWDLE